jgi:hypothetical protein
MKTKRLRILKGLRLELESNRSITSFVKYIEFFSSDLKYAYYCVRYKKMDKWSKEFVKKFTKKRKIT